MFEPYYRMGQLINVWLIGVMCGAVLMGSIRAADAGRQEARPAGKRPAEAPMPVGRSAYLSEDVHGDWVYTLVSTSKRAF